MATAATWAPLRARRRSKNAFIGPGVIATDMAAQHLDGPRGAAILAQSPFNRVATADEVAAAIVWLASVPAGWASGAVLDFNGASYLR